MISIRFFPFGIACPGVESRIDDLKEDLKDAKKELKKAKNKFNRYDRKASALEESKVQLKELKAEYEEKLDEYNSKNRKYARTIDRLKKEAEASQKTIESLKKKLTNQTSKKKTESAPSTGFEDKVSEAGKQASVVDGRIIIDFAKSVAPANASLDLNIQSSSEKVKKSAYCDSRTDEISGLEQELEEAEKDVKKWENLAINRERQANKAAGLQSIYRDLKAEYEEEIDEYISQGRKYERTIDRLKKEAEAYQKTIESLKKKLTNQTSKKKTESAPSTGFEDQVSEAGEQASVVDGRIIIDYAQRVVPTNASLKFSIHRSSDNSKVESISVNSGRINDLISFKTRIEDYHHNTIALSLNDLTDKLASQYGVKAESQTGDYWASKLRDEWLLIIDDQSHEAKSKPDWPTDADWSFHELTPEYTPGEDLSGTKQILLSPKVGIHSLKIKPKKALSCGTGYYLKTKKGDFKIKNTTNILKESKLNLDLGCPGESNSSDNSFTLKKPSKFNRASAYSIQDFDALTDTLEVKIRSFKINDPVTFAAGKNYKAVEKLAKKDFDFLYDQKKGGLYFNENSSDKGFGDGGIIAILKGAPDLTSGNLEFISS